jgi:hypothetical protein
LFNKVIIDLMAETGTLRHDDIAFAVNDWWLAEDRKAITVIGDGRFVE